MDFKEYGKTNKNSLFFVTIKLAIPVFFIGLLFTLFTNNHRQYSSGISAIKQDKEDKGDAIGMEKFFFNVRKNITTNAMDYQSMLSADIADRAMNKARKTHVLSSFPDFTWTSMGPTGLPESSSAYLGGGGGRTYAILIDNNDPTHQTLFGGGITGGIWKSTNGGGTWGSTNACIAFSQNDTLGSLVIGCIAQDSKGAIYIGTGDGNDESTTGSIGFFIPGTGSSSGEIGDGIFKSTDDGVTWRSLIKTVPTNTNNDGVAWAYVNGIVVRPDSFQVLYAATNSGLYISHDSGANWYLTVKSSNGLPVNGICTQVIISNDGSIVVATLNGSGYYCLPQSGADNAFTQFPTSGAGHLPDAGSHMVFAIAPSDPNRIYASYIDNTGLFGAGAVSSGVFMTETAKTNGGYWYKIGPGGSESFDPYSDQAIFDDDLAVPPNNENTVIIGGTTLYQWVQVNAADTVGQWYSISSYYCDYPGQPNYIHPDQHAIVFDQNNPNTAYFGCDGGIYVSNNMQTTGGQTYQALNRNYDVTQFYSIAFSPFVQYQSVNYGNSALIEGLGMGGGTQDNSSQYISGNGGYYPNDATLMTSGDGGGAAISQLNPNVAYFSEDDGTLVRTGDLTGLSYPTGAYTQTIGDSLGANIDSVESAAASKGLVAFTLPVALYENAYDLYNHDSISFTAPKKYIAGDTVWPQDLNGPTSYPYVLPANLDSGVTVTVPDRVVSRIATGFSPSEGVWINGQGASNATPLWMPIAFGTLSTPDAFVDPGRDEAPVHCLTWSANGDALFVATEDGLLFRFSNLNSIIADKYQSGALWYNNAGIHDITTKVISTNISFAAAGGRFILSLATDPQDTNNLMVTMGNYGESAYVYYSSNAASASPTFTSIQGNLPDMPVYGSVLDLRNADGTWSTNSAMVGTEHGIYTTSNINGSSTVWVKNSSGFPNTLAFALKQQTLPNWECNNSGDIYVGSLGRGIWASTTNYQAPTSVPFIAATTALSDLLIFPSPMTNEGTIEYNLASAGMVTIIIYDMQGREVKTLTMGTQSPGNHIVPFNSSDLQSGTYFASLTGTDFRKVSKFMVVK